MTRGPLEKETCDDVILPTLAAAGWSPDQIVPQVSVKARRVVSAGGASRTIGHGVVDYVLEIVPGLPVAVVEAKRAYRAASDGLQQAVRYAEQLDVPLAYASNGTDVIERDMVSGHESVVGDFPTPPSMPRTSILRRGGGAPGSGRDGTRRASPAAADGDGHRQDVHRDADRAQAACACERGGTR